MSADGSDQLPDDDDDTGEDGPTESAPVQQVAAWTGLAAPSQVRRATPPMGVPLPSPADVSRPSRPQPNVAPPAPSYAELEAALEDAQRVIAKLAEQNRALEEKLKKLSTTPK